MLQRKKMYTFVTTVLCASATVAVLAILTSFDRALNICLGFVIFFLPGYTILRLFLEGDAREPFIKYILSFLLSLALTPGLVFVSFTIGIPITLYSAAATIVTFCVVLWFTVHFSRLHAHRKLLTKKNAEQ